MVPTCASYKTFSTGEDSINLKGLGLYKAILVGTLYLFIFKVPANLFDFCSPKEGNQLDNSGANIQLYKLISQTEKPRTADSTARALAHRWPTQGPPASSEASPRRTGTPGLRGLHLTWDREDRRRGGEGARERPERREMSLETKILCDVVPSTESKLLHVWWEGIRITQT